KTWALRAMLPETQTLLQVPSETDSADWRDPKVGWGLILAEREGLSEEELASGADAPEPIRALLKARGNAPVFRYRPDAVNRFTHLRNYATGTDVSISNAPPGLAPNALPRYLLIYGSPADIPWKLQYMLNTTCSVGRLDLEGDALENYVQALLNDWKDAATQVDRAVMWTVDFGAGDVSDLIRNALAVRVYASWQYDATLQHNVLFLDGSVNQASSAALITALTQKRPALIVTMSHGQAGPCSDPTTMKAKLGLPVDQDGQPLEIDQLLASWEPDGAIWYAHACCSAGSADSTLYGCLPLANPAICLVEGGSPIDQVLKGITGLGALTAPLPRALLGAKKPLRAFVGYVEPTFDWILQQPATSQYLMENIRQALCNNIYRPMPVGLAFRNFYKSLAQLCSEFEVAFNAYSRGEDTLSVALYSQLAAREIQSMVILGDPTVMLRFNPKAGHEEDVDENLPLSFQSTRTSKSA